uniref:Uncharacterized protein n=1 Tax=Meloidogyne enterolobii TaxID=390850 RepID=A0A6V7WKW5_MELEN|nr:unnamed protein product [Meloidogyne enterolobii]
MTTEKRSLKIKLERKSFWPGNKNKKNFEGRKITSKSPFFIKQIFFLFVTLI